MRFIRLLRENDWRRLRPLGRAHYIWKAHALPLGLPLGMLFTAERFIKLGMTWSDLLTFTGAAIAYVAIMVAVLMTAAWGWVSWYRNEREFGRRDEDS